MTLLTQQEVELQMYVGGIKRAEAMMTKAEEAGRAATNPYAKTVFSSFVLQLAEAIRQEMTEKAKAPGRHAAEVKLLSVLDPTVVAYLAVRSTINSAMQGGMDNRTLGYTLGRTVHRELVLAQIEVECPELFFSLDRDFARRMSKDERHRMTVFKMQAKKHGIEIVEWGRGSRDQVGAYLLQKLIDIGMVTIDPPSKRYRQVTLSDEVYRTIMSIREYAAQSMPWYGPCVEPPRDWTSVTDGGWHTPALRARHRMLVKCHTSARPYVRNTEMPTVLAAVNALQRTAWKVNTKILSVLYDASRLGIENKELVTNVDKPKPDRQPWMDCPQESWTPEQQDQFTIWKSQMAEWYTQRKLQTSRFMRFYSATRSAEQFKDYPRLYFVYFADSRGRLYPMTYGFNPQGSDMQKALLHFADGKPLLTESAVKWFFVQGANKWGYDKATLAERCQWVRDHEANILAFAEAPLDNRDWMNAGDPFQFLAWCFEYAEWKRLGDAFKSHLPISMDGSCNGLQNFSAMLRDEVGGRATNLTANAKMEDIYRRVAEQALVRMKQTRYPDDPAKESLRKRWIEHGIERRVVKRSVMTTPYGVTRRSAEDYVVTDYLVTGAAPCFDRTEYRAAATVLMADVWPAIGDVVVKAREAMAWLRKAAQNIIVAHDGDPIISWTTPSGFLATQGYFELEKEQVRSRLVGTAYIQIATEAEEPDETRHAAGLAPNFVHSMDAAHLHLVSAAAGEFGIDSLAMIHDDYGTHAADAEKLFHLIRLKFYEMYTEHDPLFDLSIKYPEAGPPPKKGTLDLSEVLRSEFFFS